MIEPVGNGDSFPFVRLNEMVDFIYQQTYDQIKKENKP